MLTRRVGGSGCVVHPGRRLDPQGRGVAHREAAAADAELPCDRGERHDRRSGAAAVPVALEAPPASDDGRRRRCVERGEAFEVGGVDFARLRRTLDRPFVGARAKAFDAARMLVEERGRREPAIEQVFVNRQGERQIGAGPRSEVQVRLSRQGRRARIDDHELRAAACALP